MKIIMRKIFVPTHYYSEIYSKLQTLSQGSTSVNKYFKEMEVVMIKTNISADEKAIITRFLNGLNKDIANVMELQHYMEIQDMVHLIVKVTKQLMRKGNAKLDGYSGSFSSQK